MKPLIEIDTDTLAESRETDAWIAQFVYRHNVDHVNNDWRVVPHRTIGSDIDCDNAPPVLDYSRNVSLAQEALLFAKVRFAASIYRPLLIRLPAGGGYCIQDGDGENAGVVGRGGSPPLAWCSAALRVAKKYASPM